LKKQARQSAEALANRAVVLNQPHRRHLPDDEKLNAKAEHPLGRLNMFGFISDDEYEAGLIYARQASRLRSVISSWDPKLQPTPGSGGRELSEKEATSIKTAYDGAFEALESQAVQVAVKEVAIYERDCPPIWIDTLKLGLSRLVLHYGLTNQTRRSRILK
jgi:hypothetical protein